MHENVYVAREWMRVYVCMASHQKPDYVSVARQRMHRTVGTIWVKSLRQVYFKRRVWCVWHRRGILGAKKRREKAGEKLYLKKCVILRCPSYNGVRVGTLPFNRASDVISVVIFFPIQFLFSSQFCQTFFPIWPGLSLFFLIFPNVAPPPPGTPLPS